MVIYQARFETDKPTGTITVTFPDVPGCITQGKDELDAMVMAEDALRTMLGYVIGQAEDLPVSKSHRGRSYRTISLRPIASAKVELYRDFRASGIRKSELARRMGIPKTNVDRLFDLRYRSTLEQIETAFRALGKRLILAVEDAA